ncbi:RNA-guided endonuclease InsQ/TnpB family protein [Sulfuricurvum sp.]|uniref:RNA-guided endonuclease InsQ/TnpB family protein n=1 Tax=Sulfuricurvum sp. TaxID=2025608 RepID=UPI0035685E27
MERTYKFRLYPNKKQAELLGNNIDLCRLLYNNALEQRITAHKEGTSLNSAGQQRDLVKLKQNNPEYTVIYSHALQDVIKRLDLTYSHFFRRVKDKEKAGFPRFKSADRYRSITYDRYGFRVRESGRLYLTKVGEVRMFKHREIKGDMKTCNIKIDRVGDWWATIMVSIPDALIKQPKTEIGVDVGLKTLATISNGETITRHRHLKASEIKLKIIQREVARKQKGSKNRRKCVRKLAKAHRKVERQRGDYLHKASRKLADSGDIVVFENLDIRNMLKNHRLSKSISDASWGKLMQYTAYKVEETGGSVYYANPDGTSQICSRCGTVVKKSLSDRFHVCTKCGFSADRDLNASFNILKRLPTGSGELFKTPVEALPLPSLSGGGK